VTKAEARSWTRQKKGKSYHVVNENGTVVAVDGGKTPPDYYGLSLRDPAKVLERSST
jgi:hypothetical protein